jgi:hypothetical protein
LKSILFGSLALPIGFEVLGPGDKDQ